MGTDLARAAAECQICQHCVSFPGWQPATLWQAGYTKPLSPCKEQHFVLTGVYTYSVMDVPFLHIMPLPKPPFVGLQMPYPPP